jgi:hypothetical protein
MVRKINALLSYHFHIPHPEELADEVWADKWQQLKWVLKFESKRHSGDASVKF